MDSIDKRNSVKEDYDLIADVYCDEYGSELQDIELVKKFESLLDRNSYIVDLGGGSGKITDYLIKNGYRAVCYDFSINMKKNSLRLYGELPYILDDILNIKNHFNNSEVDGIIAMYSLFHIPRENIKQLFIDINSVLKENGIFCFSFQLGDNESFEDEPYLKDDGKNVLYMNYFNKEQIYDLLNECGFDKLHEEEKHEDGENVIGEDGNDAIYIIARKK